MKKMLFLLAPAMLVAGCAQDLELTGPENVATPPPEGVSEMRTRSLERAVYNEVVDAWMIPQADPYTLANFQAAYDKLAAEKKEFAPAKKLKPTHYALKIYPKTEEEQWRVEKMEDVNVAYIPFSFVQLTQEEAVKVEKAKTRSAANTFPEKSPYTVTYKDYKSTNGGPTDPQTYQLPILYTVWPVDKPLPADLEYKMDYEIFLPNNENSAAQLSKEAMPLLWGEAKAFVSESYESYGSSMKTRGLPPVWIQREIWVSGGPITTHDNTVGRNVPIGGFTVQYNDGSLFSVSDVMYNGYWTDVKVMLKYQHDPLIPIPDYPSDDVSLQFIYKDRLNRWKITPENSTIPIGFSRTFTITDRGQNIESLGPITVSDGGRNETSIVRAVSYFFDSQSAIPIPSLSGGIQIIAQSNQNLYEGAFLWYEDYAADPWIEIYNNNSPDAEVVGATLHELGHFAHYMGTSSGPTAYYYQRAHKGLRESFAPYVDWSLGESYYTSLGWIRPPASNYYPSGDITGDSRQNWLRTHRMNTNDLGEYTPLFVDLVDNYNQRAYLSPVAPNDGISGVPASVIWSIITTSPTWAQCRAKLQSYVGTYYSTSEFNNWVADFDFWFAQPHNN